MSGKRSEEEVVRDRIYVRLGKKKRKRKKMSMYARNPVVRERENPWENKRASAHDLMLMK
jgi:hypothetical protein